MGDSTLAAAAEEGEKELLVAMRKALADKIDGGQVASHALAGLCRQLLEVDKQIRQVEIREEFEQDLAGDQPYSPVTNRGRRRKGLVGPQPWDQSEI
jgi:hypothetical protein